MCNHARGFAAPGDTMSNILFTLILVISVSAILCMAYFGGTWVAEKVHKDIGSTNSFVLTKMLLAILLIGEICLMLVGAVLIFWAGLAKDEAALTSPNMLIVIASNMLLCGLIGYFDKTIKANEGKMPGKVKFM